MNSPLVRGASSRARISSFRKPSMLRLHETAASSKLNLMNVMEIVIMCEVCATKEHDSCPPTHRLDFFGKSLVIFHRKRLSCINKSKTPTNKKQEAKENIVFIPTKLSSKMKGYRQVRGQQLGMTGVRSACHDVFMYFMFSFSFPA